MVKIYVKTFVNGIYMYPTSLLFYAKPVIVINYKVISPQFYNWLYFKMTGTKSFCY